MPPFHVPPEEGPLNPPLAQSRLTPPVEGDVNFSAMVSAIAQGEDGSRIGVLASGVQAAYAAEEAAGALPPSSSRATFVSALAIDSTGLATLRKAGAAAKVTLALDRLALPAGAVITNLAVLLPGVEGGNFGAELRLGNAAPTLFTIKDGLAMSNSGALSDGSPANVLPLNQTVGGSPDRPAVLTIDKGADGARLAKARDVLLWLEYDAP